jgi:hypothetical protein
LKQADSIAAQTKDIEEELTRLWTILIKRHRAAPTNIADSVGIFSPTSGKFLSVEASNLHPINITEPTVRANTSTVTQAQVACEIVPATPEYKGAASIAEAIYNFIDSRDWTESLEVRCAELAQLSSAAFLRSYYDAECEAAKMRVPDVIETSLGDLGEYACESCGQSGQFDAKDLVKLQDEYKDTDYKGDFFCPNCGGKCEILEMPGESYVQSLSFNEIPNGDTKTEVVSPFEIRMDLRGTEGGDFHKGEYFERHRLRSRAWIEEQCPGIKLGKPQLPSYSLRWQHALQNGLRNVRETWGGKDMSDDDLFEVREIYLKPARYKHFSSKKQWTMQGEDRQVLFTVEIGETFDEAIRRNVGNGAQSADDRGARKGSISEVSDFVSNTDYGNFSAKGICFWVCDGKIIKAPHYADFCENWSIIQFAPDAYSAWARPFSIILQVSDDVTTLNTLSILHLEKHTIANVVVDTEQFDFEDFENDFVPTREGSVRDRPIRDYFAVVEPPRLGGEAVSYMSFLLKIKDDLSGVQPAAIGASQPGQPYAAQLLQVNQSQGLLSPYLKSKAQAKVTWLRQQLKLVQKYWSEEQFRYVESRYGSEWKGDDLEAFYQADLDKAIIITYKQGTEIPKTLQQRELKLNNFVMQVMQLAQLNPSAIHPQMIQELVSQMAGYADVDFDAGNYEGDKRLAKFRLDLLKEAVSLFHRQGFEVGVNPETGESQLPAAALHVITEAGCLPNPRSENHEMHKEFWADQLRANAADSDSDELLTECFNKMWELHDQATVAQAQNVTQNQLDANAPVEAKQEEMQQKQLMAAEAEDEKMRQDRAAEMMLEDKQNTDKLEADLVKDLIKTGAKEGQNQSSPPEERDDPLQTTVNG